ncbi:daptide biosynthesis intramembrane metalloprotease [Streptomyces chrestomyceticus]|uniref:daptide biosynthesis intramembrane metalloprotease n=1 Tax=Streptomyces chrestomyceticus TaxID=68185 RepID=UPI0033C958F1
MTSAAPSAPAEPVKIPAYPARRNGLEIVLPDGQGPAVVSLPEGRYLRLGQDAARVLAHLDGSRSREAVIAELACAMDEKTATGLLERFTGAGLLERPDAPPPRTTVRRVAFRPPASLQFTLLRPERLFAALRPVTRRLARPAAGYAYVLLLLAGAVAAVAGADQLGAAMTGPTTWRTFLAAAVAMITVTALHEFGHGLALAHFGGTPRRMGFMLLYLSPAFFCDVSDGWRLPEKRQRVVVSLAGPAVNAGVAALAALATLVADGPTAAFCSLLAVGNGIGALFNLTPFVKFDGYIALMSQLDIPFLRDRAMTDARHTLGRLVFGGGPAERKLASRWAVPYGTACLLTPWLLVGWALSAYLPMLLAFGVLGAMIWLSTIAMAVSVPLRGIARLLHAARTTGARTLRMATGGLVAATVVTAVLTLVRVPTTVPAAYVTEHGRHVLILPDSGTRPTLHAGDRVELRTAGLLLHPLQATATLATDQPTRGHAPLAGFLPLHDIPGQIPVLRYELSGDTGPAPEQGTAAIAAGDTSLGERLAQTFLTPALRALAP